MTRRLFAASLALTLSACGPSTAPPLAQWRVSIGTDAPLPQFADRMLVEVLDAKGQACSGCRRQFGVGDPSVWPISFGIAAPSDGSAVLVRARLYRASVTGPDGTPGGDRILDALGSLPAPSGVTDVNLPLLMSCFGVTADVAAGTTCDASTRARAPLVTLEAGASRDALPMPGTWLPGRTVPCAGSTPAGMSCVEGGAFLLGSASFVPLGGGEDPTPEQLVQIAPFFLDVDEMTVATMRTLVGMGVPAPLSQTTGGDARCTFAATGNDTSPVNCVSRATAAAACAALGKRLPTEAEWELAAGNGDQETKYPWGVGDPCDESNVGHGDPTDITMSTYVSCLVEKGMSTPVGPQPVGAMAGDITIVGGLRDMGGNLSEIVADDFRPYADPACWGPEATLHVNPKCTATGMPVLRGGNWGALPFTAAVYGRNSFTTEDGADAFTGFRCAK